MSTDNHVEIELMNVIERILTDKFTVANGEENYCNEISDEKSYLLMLERRVKMQVYYMSIIFQ